MSDDLTYVKVTFKTVALPRYLPSMIFLAWRGDACQGETQFYSGNAGQIQLNESFIFPFIPYFKSSISLSVNSRSNVGACFRFGDSTIPIPHEFEKDEDIEHNYEIKTEIGSFYVEMAFSLSTNLGSVTDPSLNAALFKGDINRYADYITSLQPILTSDQTISDMWGSDGLITQLIRMKSSACDTGAISDLEKLSDNLRVKSDRAQFRSQVLTTVVSSLIGKDPIYVDQNGAKIDQNSLYSQNTKRFPLLGIQISQFIQTALTTATFEDRETPFIDLCTYLAGLIADTQISEYWLLYIVSSSHFAYSFLTKKFPGKFATFITMLGMANENAVSTYLSRITAKINQTVLKPKKIGSFLESVQLDLPTYYLPKKTAKQILDYILRAIDFSSCNIWLLSETQSPFDYNSLKSASPDYEWPISTSLNKIISGADSFVLQKASKSSLPESMRGPWFTMAIEKLVAIGSKKYTPKQISSASSNSTQIPFLPNLDEWSHNNCSLSNDLEIPDPLPGEQKHE